MGQFKDPEGESEVLEEATEYLIQQAIGLGDDDDDEAFDTPIKAGQAQPSMSAPVAAHPEGRSMPEANMTSDMSASAAGRAEIHADLKVSEAWRSSKQAALAEDHATEGNAGPSDANSSIRRLQAHEVEQDGSAGGEELDADMYQELSEDEVAQLALATARQSSTWGRIIRPPRKKGRHVILDLCTPLSALPQHRQAELYASRQAALGTAAAPKAQGELTLSMCRQCVAEGLVIPQTTPRGQS